MHGVPFSLKSKTVKVQYFLLPETHPFTLFDYRLELDIEKPMRSIEVTQEILHAISKCASLVQLYLNMSSRAIPLVPKFNAIPAVSKLNGRLFSKKFLSLVDTLTNLICLYCFMNVPKSYCVKTTKLLTEIVTPKRPSFCVQLLSQQVCETYSTLLPFIHSKPLIDYRENFSSFPYEDN